MTALDPRAPEGSGRRSKRYVALVVGFLLLVVLAIVLWPSRPRRESELPPTRREPVRAAAPGEVGHPMERASPSLAVPSTPEPPPVIDEVRVEKPEVCSGEENLVTVRAHTLNRTDPFLHYVVDGQMGSSVPLRLWLGEDGSVHGDHFIRVFGRTNTAVTVPVPAYRVKDCQPRRLISIEQHLRANSWSDFDFVAKLVTLPAPGERVALQGKADPFVPLSFAWSFGDGETATTDGPLVSHDYEGRAQGTLYSYFTVQVEVKSRAGESLVGRAALSLLNTAFESFEQKGIVQILIALDPRFPVLGADERVVQRVRLWHTRPEPVTIETATLSKHFESGSGQTAAQPIGVAEVLGNTVIPLGSQGITTTVILDTLAEPGVVSATYRISGRSQSGSPAMGSFSIMRPPPKPTADNSRRVSDPTLKAKILATREILGKEVVTDEDIWQLERGGMLNNLVTNPSAVTAPLSSMPPAPPSTIDPRVPARGPPVPTSVTPLPTSTMAPVPPRPASAKPGAPR